MNSAKILIVEDELIAAEGLAENLRNSGYEVFDPVPSGEEAIETTRQLQPDLILMDIVLLGSKMDGISASQRIQEEFDIPVIYLTAYDNQEIVNRAISTGGYGYVLKPPNSQQLRATIELALRRHYPERYENEESTLYPEELQDKIPQSFENDLPQGDDRLNIQDEIDALTTILMLRDLDPPLAVGILGNWGSGKSFAMHLMKQKINKIRSDNLDKYEIWDSTKENLYPFVGHIYQIEFDAWTYAKSNLWASMMQRIFSELDRQLSLEHKIQEAGKENNSNLLLEGGTIWEALNSTIEDSRRAILNSNLKTILSKSLSEINASPNASEILWKELRNLKEAERKQLKQQEEELEKKQEIFDREHIKLEQEVDRQVKLYSSRQIGDGLQKELITSIGDKFIKELENRLKELALKELEKIKKQLAKIIEQLEKKFDSEEIGKAKKSLEEIEEKLTKNILDLEVLKKSREKLEKCKR